MSAEATLTSGASSSLPFEKLYLLNPKRIEMIKSFRQHVDRFRAMILSNPIPVQTIHTTASHFKTLPTSNIPKKPFHLTPITLREMDPTLDRIYANRILNLTLIEDPQAYIGYPSVNLIAEDDNGDATWFYVYNFPQTSEEETRKIFYFGRRLSIVHPYFRICMDETTAIRVDNPKTIIYKDEAIVNMCRYCGEENASKKCSRCKWALYCSKECQKRDWKELHHKFICAPAPCLSLERS